MVGDVVHDPTGSLEHLAIRCPVHCAIVRVGTPIAVLGRDIPLPSTKQLSVHSDKFSIHSVDRERASAKQSELSDGVFTRKSTHNSQYT